MRLLVLWLERIEKEKKDHFSTLRKRSALLSLIFFALVSSLEGKRPLDCHYDPPTDSLNIPPLSSGLHHFPLSLDGHPLPAPNHPISKVPRPNLTVD